MKSTIPPKKLTLKQQSIKLEKKLFKNAYCIIIPPKEAKYLMGGSVTEMIESQFVKLTHREGDYEDLTEDQEEERKAFIYGVRAENEKYGRYVWLYVRHDYHLWRCYGIERAIEIIKDLRDYDEICYLIEVEEEKKSKVVKQKIRA